jgi:hypothetical protein
VVDGGAVLRPSFWLFLDNMSAEGAPPLFFFCYGGQFQAAWTPPVTVNMGQKIFATFILFQ